MKKYENLLKLCTQICWIFLSGHGVYIYIYKARHWSKIAIFSYILALGVTVRISPCRLLLEN